MPTNFPTSVDNFANPTPTDSLNAPAHSGQHTNANDAIEAVESFLLGTTGNAYTAWTPTVSSSAGTITTKSGAGVFTRVGKTVHLRAVLSIVTNGTGSGSISFTLPVTAINTFAAVGAGRENNVTGKMLQVYLAGSTTIASVVNFDNTYPAANGTSLLVSLTYEAA
jgi:hypothetical protein